VTEAPWPLATTTLRERTAVAVADPVLRRNIANAADRFGPHRVATFETLHDPEGLRQAARGVRSHVLAHWAQVLERLADNVIAAGGHVCWAPTAADANRYIADVASRIGATTIVKSKSMATEEIGLNDVLQAQGVEVVETDLGEWIIQLAHETPSHIIAPAMHRDRHSITELFEQTSGERGLSSEPTDLNAFARVRLREEFLRADLGISGANFGVAESGSIVLVTNEGNGRMVTTIPRVHVAVMGAERVVNTWDQADLILGLLAKAASGQLLSTYTSITTGPRREGEVDGPDEFHLVILDNGRSEIAGTEFAEMLNCIRCGSCLNVCPVYRQTGGHAYGWVYSGPMGAVLTPLLAASEPHAAELAGASTLCGACRQACPVDIPLPDLLLALRRRKAVGASRATKAMWRAWSTAWSRPATFRLSARVATRARVLAPLLGRLPAGKRWTADRRLPALPKRTFSERWKAGEV
jgi:L-lactate dehydrogenase complex protein LldF